MYLDLYLKHHYEYPTKLRRLLESSWLINSKGGKDTWVPADLAVEHMVFWIKDALIAAKASASFEVARHASLNYDLNAFLRRSFPRSVGLRVYSRPHHQLPRETEVAHGVSHLIKYKINTVVPGRKVERPKDQKEFQDYHSKGLNDWSGSISSDYHSHRLASLQAVSFKRVNTAGMEYKEKVALGTEGSEGTTHEIGQTGDVAGLRFSGGENNDDDNDGTQPRDEQQLRGVQDDLVVQLYEDDE